MTSAFTRLVVFDLGEVLSRPKDILHEVAEQVRVSADEIAPGYWQWREEYDKGMTPLEYWTRVLERTGLTVSHNEAERLSDIDSTAWAQLEEPELALLTELSVHRIPLVLLSNSPSVVADVVSRQQWSGLFDRIYVSAVLGTAKPDQEIFRLVESDFHVDDPHTIVFFDDRQENIDAAVMRGWDAVLWQSTDQMRQDLIRRQVVSGR